jgi:3-hydroxyisobutyrate dehydrogenase-like beta-hydroxyacid dehydrogenase
MVNAARRVSPYLAKEQIYFDINSASPMAKKEACAVVENAGSHFVEAAVMDLVPPHGHKVPMLLAGKRAKQIEPVLQSYGMNVRAIGETIGVASTIKMVRSVFLKGFSAILIESLIAAGKVGAEEEVINSLQVTFPQLDWHKLSDYYANRLVKHARRQAAEMHEVAETLEYLKLEPLMAMATAKRLEWLADHNLDNGHRKIPDTYKELLSELSNS